MAEARVFMAFDIHEKSGAVMTYLANDFEHLDDLYAGPPGRQQASANSLTSNTKLWADLDLAEKWSGFPTKAPDGWAIDGIPGETNRLAAGQRNIP